MWIQCFPCNRYSCARVRIPLTVKIVASQTRISEWLEFMLMAAWRWKFVSKMNEIFRVWECLDFCFINRQRHQRWTMNIVAASSLPFAHAIVHWIECNRVFIEFPGVFFPVVRLILWLLCIARVLGRAVLPHRARCVWMCCLSPYRNIDRLHPDKYPAWMDWMIRLNSVKQWDEQNIKCCLFSS